MLYILISIGALIIAGLGFYAGQLLWQVQQQKQKQEEESQKRKDYLTHSISHIAKAMQAEQCEYSEGVLRIWVLLDHYNKEITEPKDYANLYPGFATLYEIIKDMPTHDARKKYDKKEIAKLDMRRWRAEKEHEEQIGEDLDKLLKEF